MPISDELLRGAIPRLGSISVGYATTRTTAKGAEVPKPHKAKGLVLHTDDGTVANAALELYGGTVRRDSPTWAFDVELEPDTEVEALALPAGFRQWLEHWRAAECIRRCDGLVMTTRDGRSTSEPCMCEPEMAAGKDRVCKPASVLPVLLDLDVERFGVWEVRSTGWSSARRVKGAVMALEAAGAGRGQLPVVLRCQMRTVRDPEGKVQTVPVIDVAIAAGAHRLAALSRGASGELGPAPEQLEGLPELPPAPDAEEAAGQAEERARVAMLTDHAALMKRAEAADVDSFLSASFREQYPDVAKFGELSLEELTRWMVTVRDVVGKAEGGGEDEPTDEPKPGPECPVCDSVDTLWVEEGAEVVCNACGQDWHVEEGS